jgi:hypothetical protein
VEIYIKVCVHDGFRKATLWWNRDENGRFQFLEKNNEFCYSNGFEDLYAGTACTSVRAAKAAAKTARTLAEWDGYKVNRISFWAFNGKGNFVQIKLK